MKKIGRGLMVMTEKRFTRISVCGDWGIKDTLTDKVLFFGTTEEVEITLEVLNMLHEENQSLKEQLRNLRRLANERTALGKSVLRQLLDKLE